MTFDIDKIAAIGLLAIACGWQAGAARAAVSANDAARLQADLTPVGAEKAASKDGTIPAWTGGFSPTVPHPGGRRTDPFASEKPVFAITAQNLDKHSDKLTPGLLALFKRYPATFRMDVYPTHRTAAMPAKFYDATFKSATGSKLKRDADGHFSIDGDAGGVPFPMPQDGAEAIFNHLVYYAPVMRTVSSNYLLQADGRRVLISTFTNDFARYNTGEERLKGQYFAVRSQTIDPPIRAGEQIVGHFFTDPRKDTSWVYLPGQRRIRKLPNSCCDTPTPFSSGLISFDELAMLQGNPYKFDWTLAGKKEIYVPYNSNRFYVPTKADEVIGKNHLNPDFVRWELHRVWVVEAKLRPGERHVSPRSTYYLDEDSWQCMVSERYDAQGQLVKAGYMVPILLTENSALNNSVEAFHDIQSGAAYFGSIANEAAEPFRMLDSIPRAQVSPDAMASESVR